LASAIKNNVEAAYRRATTTLMSRWAAHAVDSTQPPLSTRAIAGRLLRAPSDVHAFQDGASMAAFPIQLSPDDMKTIAEMVADLIGRPKNRTKSQHGVAPAALKACDVARYLGVSRARFYELLMVDQALRDAAIMVGSRCLARQATGEGVNNGA
jgi:hypothetical protein